MRKGRIAILSAVIFVVSTCFVFGQVPASSVKKTVFIIADNKVTEMFDMLAPYYLFSQTGKLNVLIVAKDKSPITIKKKLFLLPQLSFREVDSMKLKADVIVIPALSHIDDKQDPVVISFIKNHYSETTKVLAVCDGASTAAATGIFDGKPITCHASDFRRVKSHFPTPHWIQEVTVAHSGNLYSTAGVSNAVEGALMVIRDLYDMQTMHAVASDIHYPHPDIMIDHRSGKVNVGTGFSILHKIIFHKGRKIGLFLQDGVNEFEMVSVLDTYMRTFPKSLTCFTAGDSILHTKFGLTLVCTGDRQVADLDEVHLLSGSGRAPMDAAAEVVQYQNNQYPIDVCIDRIGKLYGGQFKTVVQLILDYN